MLRRIGKVKKIHDTVKVYPAGFRLKSRYDIFVDRLSRWWTGCRNSIFITTFSFFTCNFLLQLLSSRPVVQNVWFEKHASEVFQYSSVLFDNRFKLNNDLKAIVEMTRPNKHQSRTVGQIVKLPRNFMHCGAKFNMLRKLLANDRHFSPDNVWEYLALNVNKSLEWITVV